MAVTGTNNFELANLKPKHHQVASLLAQGLGPLEISKLVDITPQYVTMLQRDPLFKAALSEMVEFAETQLEAQFLNTPKVIGDVMAFGTNDERLKAARLQAELTGRIGKLDRPTEASSGEEKLVALAEKLLKLQAQTREKGTVIDVEPS